MREPAQPGPRLNVGLATTVPKGARALPSSLRAHTKILPPIRGPVDFSKPLHHQPRTKPGVPRRCILRMQRQQASMWQHSM